MSDANLAKPPVGVGHMTLTVADVETSHRFYTTLGLRVVGKRDDMSILELRGGTHLLLFQRGGPSSGSEVESPFEQAQASAIDLMIEGRTFEDLDAYRTALIAGGVEPDPISDKRFFGHYIFKARDPDGNEVTVSTSHASDQPV
ncbi:MAG TPA: VOC family protein [Caulobacteraceae bacterium]|jgi:catechol 2,3-dioxygenase-like lactoylglutathione lyase family enzyme